MVQNWDIHLSRTRDGKWAARVESTDQPRQYIEGHTPGLTLLGVADLITAKLFEEPCEK